MGIFAIPVGLIYILISFLIARSVYKAKKKKYIAILTMAGILLLPFTDLIAQKAIKTYYQVFLLEPKIYSYPKFDADGEIGSLKFANTTGYIDYLIKENRLEKSMKYVIKDYQNLKIKNYVEFYIEPKAKFLRININTNAISYHAKSGAEYAIKYTERKNRLFGFYKTGKYKFINTITNKTLGELIGFDFPRIKVFSDFRKKVLFLVGSNGDSLGFVVFGDSGYKNLFKKLKLVL